MGHCFVNMHRKTTASWCPYICLWFCVILGCASEDTTDALSVPDAGTVDADLTQIGQLTPEYCDSYHQSHFEQWRISMHAFATKDPIFQAMNKKGIEETGGLGTDDPR